MNLTDLRDELTTQAGAIDALTDLRPGVAAKVRQTRRRRTVAAGGVATLAVAAFAVGVLTSVGRPAHTAPATTSSASAAPMIGADGMPYRPVPDGPGDVVKDGLRYRARVGDDRLVAGVIGDRGQRQLTLTWTPTTTHVSLGAECYLPGLTSAQAGKYLVSVGLEGRKGVFGTQCSGNEPTERDLSAGGGIPGEPDQGWPELTVGQPVRARVQLVDAKTFEPASVDGAQLTGAVYEQGTLQPVKDEAGTTVAALPTVIEHQGYRYRLAGVATGPLASGTLPELGVPNSVYAGVALPGGPFLVSWGSAGTNPAGASGASGSDGSRGLRLDGLEDSEARDYGSWGVVPVPAGSTRSMRLVAEGARPDHGTAFIVVYTPEHARP